MSLLRSLAALLVASTAALAALGCAPPGVSSNVEHTSESEDAAVAFEVLDVRRNDAEAGLTVIKSKAAYRQFFGQEPPAGLSFNASWVLHYSMGIKPTGGFGTEIVSIEKAGSGSQRTLIVTTADTEPGMGCFVTQALTNPQIAVRINKHPGTAVKGATEVVVTDCGDHDFCPLVRCNMGTTCDEALNECVGNICDPDRTDECGPGLACQNVIRCITTPCPEQFRCTTAPEDPCQGFDYNGTCDGTVVRWCEDDTFQATDCGAEGCDVDGTGFADCR